MDKEYMLVQDKKTGKIYAAKEDYARKLEDRGDKRIVAKEGDSEWKRLSKLRK